MVLVYKVALKWIPDVKVLHWEAWSFEVLHRRAERKKVIPVEFQKKTVPLKVPHKLTRDSSMDHDFFPTDLLCYMWVANSAGDF